VAKRYNDFNGYLKRAFGCRVQKLTIDVGFSCPNRDGTLSSLGCLFCDGRGSGSGAHQQGLSVSAQIAQGKARLGKRYHARKFMAYFQAFTNTYAEVPVLRKRYDEAVSDPDVVGLAIGTRPDCVDEKKLDLIESYARTHMVWIEYGLQSMHDRTLTDMNRGHTFKDFVRAVEMTRGHGILVCAHVIIGLPGESKNDVVQTADALAALEIDGVKIHSLYIQDDTPLAERYRSGKVPLLDRDTYVDWVVAFLEHLPQRTVIQRLTGDPHRDLLVAPAWTLDKYETLKRIDTALERLGTAQGAMVRGRPNPPPKKRRSNCF